MTSPKTPFFTLKKLLHITAWVLVIYVLIWGGVVVKNMIDHNNRARVVNLRQEQVKGLSREEQAIQRAQEYLVGSINTIGTSERIFLSYLQRKFDLPGTLGTEGPPIDLYEDPRTYPAEIHFLARIAYPDRVVTVPPKYELDDGVKVTNIYSANCDHLALPANYWRTVEQNVAAGGYYLAHVPLAFVLMKDNGCTLIPGAEDINNKALQELVRLADDPKTIADLRYEAVAFLLLSGKNDLVQPRWIDKIISEQREDGGWSKEVGGNKNDPHSTLLALWSLLEYSRPNTPNEPLIRRPTKPL